MTTTAIVDARIFDGTRHIVDHAVLLRNQEIVDVCPISQLPGQIGRTVSLDGRLLAPGFIDLQVNGGGGRLFTREPTIETLRMMGAAHRRYGTTGFLPTVISSDLEIMRAAVEAVEGAAREGVPGILGIHFEGPFICDQKSGVHDKSKIRALDDIGARVLRSLDFGKTMVTLAPDRVSPHKIRELVSQEIVVCIGHSNADYQTTTQAIAAGARGFTHAFNAMSQMSARQPGIVGAALASDNTWFGIIADGIHVHPAVFSIAVRAKQPGGVILVTDAMSTVGTNRTSFDLNGERIEVRRGQCLDSKGQLAGSTLTMDKAVRNASSFASIDQAEALRMATLYPARALSLDTTLGRIQPGYPANMVELDNNLLVHGTWLEGHFEPSEYAPEES